MDEEMDEWPDGQMNGWLDTWRCGLTKCRNYAVLQMHPQMWRMNFEKNFGIEGTQKKNGNTRLFRSKVTQWPVTVPQTMALFEAPECIMIHVFHGSVSNAYAALPFSPCCEIPEGLIYDTARSDKSCRRIQLCSFWRRKNPFIWNIPCIDTRKNN